MTTSSDDNLGPVDGQHSGDDPAGSEPVGSEPVGDETVGNEPAEDSAYGEPDSSKNWMGIAAFLTGALGLSVVAIVLGHLGLSAVKKQQATNRAFALAGLILGYIALAATVAAIALYMLVYAPAAEQDTNDAYAQVDTVAVGSEIARHWIDNGVTPSVALEGGQYVVEASSIDAMLETDRTVTYYGTQPTEWCLMIEYAGGGDTAWSYLPSEGLVSGAQCDDPPGEESEPELDDAEETAEATEPTPAPEAETEE